MSKRSLHLIKTVSRNPRRKDTRLIPFEVTDSRIDYSLTFLPRDVVCFIFWLLDWLSLLKMRQTCKYARAACSWEMLDKACLRALTKWPKMCTQTEKFALSAVTCHSRESKEATCSCARPVYNLPHPSAPQRPAGVPAPYNRIGAMYAGEGHNVAYEPRKKRYCQHDWVLPVNRDQIDLLFRYLSTPEEFESIICSCAHPDDSVVFGSRSGHLNRAQIYAENNVKTWKEIVIVALKSIDDEENASPSDQVHSCYVIGGWELAYAYASKHNLSKEFVEKTATYEAYMKYQEKNN